MMWVTTERSKASQRTANRFRARQVISLGDRVESSNLLSGEAHSHNLHRLSTATRPATSATLQLFDVITGLGLGRPFLNLLFGTHEQIV